MDLALEPELSVAQHWNLVRDDALGLSTEAKRQLLPLVHRRLLAANVGGDDVEALGRIVRDFWVHDQLLFLDLEAAVEVLDNAGVAHLALKGVPLALAHYPDVSLRPMVDADLLVHPEAATRAVSALRDAGWTIEWELHPEFVARTTEVPCRSPSGQSIVDLHWRLVPWVGRSWSAPDPELWSAAEPLTLGVRSTLAPGPPDLALHVLLHAYRSGWNHVPRYVADIVVVLRRCGGSFDWDRFTARVLDAHLTLPVLEGLGYVADRFAAPIPKSVLRTLRDAPVSRRERHKHRLAGRPIAEKRHWLYGDGQSLHTSWSRISINYAHAAELRSLRQFLAGRMHTDQLWTLPVVVARRRLGGHRRPGKAEVRSRFDLPGR